jgi:hypothetical protein
MKGGTSDGGKLLKELILYRTRLEDEILQVSRISAYLIGSTLISPQLKMAIPELELEAIDSGLYYVNLHIITARKPQNHRLGDLLSDGTRQEMTDQKYDAMIRFDGGKTSKWTRHLKFRSQCVRISEVN